MNETSIMTLRITLNGTKPPIWRRMAVLSDITLGQLYEVIQIVMGWTDSHMHQFILRDKSPKPKLRELPKSTGRFERKEIILPDGRRGIVLTTTPSPNSPESVPAKPVTPIPMSRDRYFVTKVTPWGDPTEMEGEDENAVMLGEVCPKVKSKLIYEYDFGDSWEHIIEVQKIIEPEPGVKYPVCLAGKKACPPEDCGVEAADAYPGGLRLTLRDTRQKHEASQNFTLGVAFCCSVASKYSAFSTPAMLQKLLPKKERA